mmetsp:Transcript_14536/g.43404  ORF Transcript_14536/g.43404 Transcript_14536/m.43404 type:complete len:534 (+) Transcript_14536:309-1910(+)
MADFAKTGGWGDDDDAPAPALAPGAPAPPAMGKAGVSDEIAGLTSAVASSAIKTVQTIEMAGGGKIQVERASGDTSELVAARTWEELQLDPALLRGVYLAKFEKPFKIQEAALPLILAGFRQAPVRHNVLAQAKSGSGKTAAFALGLLQNCNLANPDTQALVVCPSRELANQNKRVIEDIGRVLREERGLIIAAAVSEGGGKGKGGRGRGGGRGRAAKEPVVAHVVVGTPGRVIQLIRGRQLRTQSISMLVLDEADEMDAKGHRDDTRTIRRALPDSAQVLCFSATYTAEICRDIEASVFLAHPASKILIAAADEGTDRSAVMVNEIAHVWCDAAEHPSGKLGIIEDIFDELAANQAIIFINTRREVTSLTKILTDKNFSVEDLTGGLDAKERDRVMEAFRLGKVKVLITTNVISRGIDVPGVNIVVNYDLPVVVDYSQPRGASTKPPEPDSDTYIHRVGRTGRKGCKGVAINLVDQRTSNGLDLQILAGLEALCFGRQPAKWTKIKKVPDASDVEVIKRMIDEHIATIVPAP